jgi:hypothetical protein
LSGIEQPVEEAQAELKKTEVAAVSAVNEADHSLGDGL